MSKSWRFRRQDSFWKHDFCVRAGYDRPHWPPISRRSPPMPQRIITTALLLVAAFILMSPECAADERDKLKVGPQPDGRIVVPTNQILHPAGTQVTFAGRPVDLLLIEGERLLVAKNMRDLVFIDPATGAIQQTLALPAGVKGLARAFSAV